MSSQIFELNDPQEASRKGFFWGVDHDDRAEQVVLAVGLIANAKEIVHVLPLVNDLEFVATAR